MLFDKHGKDYGKMKVHFKQPYFSKDIGWAEQTPEFDRKILVCFHIPYEIALKQNAMREGPSVVPLPVMEKMRREFEKPNQKTIDLFDEYLIIGKSFVSEELKEKK